VADIGPLLAALAAGAASSLSPYAARGIGTAANVLGAFDENRYRKIQAQRVQEGLAKEAEERRRKAEIESRAINFFTKNTEYGEPGQPFRPPAAGVGRGIPEQQAEALKLITLSRGAGPALESASDLLSQRAQPTSAEIIARPRPPAGVRQSFKTREGDISISGPEEYAPRAERAPTAVHGYGVTKFVDPETGRVISETRVPVAPREPKIRPEDKGITQLQRDQVEDEIAALRGKLEAARNAKDEDKLPLSTDQKATLMRPILADINRKYRMLKEPRTLSLRKSGGAPAPAAPQPLKGKAAADAFLAKRGVR